MFSKRELRFAHYSVKEYLVSTRIECVAYHCFKVSNGLAHRLLTRISLIYLLSFEEPTLIELDLDDRDLGESHLDGREYPLLHYAAQFWFRHFHTESLEALQLPENDLATKLFDPTSRYKFIHWLQAYDPDRSPIDLENNFSSPLYYSSLLGLCGVAEWLLKMQVDVNRDSEGTYGNALQAASVNGNEVVVQLLLDHRANVNAAGGIYGNTLQAASRNGNEVVVQLLLDHGANVNAAGGIYGNALQVASFYGNEVVVQLLLDHRANVNAAGGIYGNALQAASFYGNEVVFQLLLDHGATAMQMDEI
jgi:ankyrin repeat protein